METITHWDLDHLDKHEGFDALVRPLGLSGPHAVCRRSVAYDDLLYHLDLALTPDMTPLNIMGACWREDQRVGVRHWATPPLETLLVQKDDGLVLLVVKDSE